MKNWNWKPLAQQLLLVILGLIGYNEYQAVPEEEATEVEVLSLGDFENKKWEATTEKTFKVRGDVMLTKVDTVSNPGQPSYIKVLYAPYYLDGHEITLKGKKYYSRKDVIEAIGLSKFMKKYYKLVGDVDPGIEIWPVKPMPVRDEKEAVEPRKE